MPRLLSSFLTAGGLGLLVLCAILKGIEVRDCVCVCGNGDGVGGLGGCGFVDLFARLLEAISHATPRGLSG